MTEQEELEKIEEQLDWLGVPRANMTVSDRLKRLMDYVPQLHNLVKEGRTIYERWYGKDND